MQYSDCVWILKVGLQKSWITGHHDTILLGAEWGRDRMVSEHQFLIVCYSHTLSPKEHRISLRMILGLHHIACYLTRCASSRHDHLLLAYMSICSFHLKVTFCILLASWEGVDLPLAEIILRTDWKGWSKVWSVSWDNLGHRTLV